MNDGFEEHEAGCSWHPYVPGGEHGVCDCGRRLTTPVVERLREESYDIGYHDGKQDAAVTDEPTMPTYEQIAPLPEDARMEAYYYGFERTGIGFIDAILSAVAIAGKGAHHTESWGSPWEGTTDYFRGHPGLPDGDDAVDLIQKAAQQAADAVLALLNPPKPSAEPVTTWHTADCPQEPCMCSGKPSAPPPARTEGEPQ